MQGSVQQSTACACHEQSVLCSLLQLTGRPEEVQSNAAQYLIQTEAPPGVVFASCLLACSCHGMLRMYLEALQLQG